MRGLLLALSAYVIWGAFPLYFSFLAQVPPMEVLSNRIVWAFVATLIAVMVMGKLPEVLALLRKPKAIGWLALSSLLIALNWLIFIWAVTNHRVLESSLGYFMTPLVSMALGRLLLSEKINKLQATAGILAALAVAFELFSLGKLPWLSLALAFSFGFYGLVRKQQSVGSMTGLVIETLLILPLALLYLWFYQEQLHFTVDIQTTVLLVASGVVTAVPLFLFAAATKHLDLTVVGFVMYINPTMQFLTAIWIFNEPYSTQRLFTFALIWVAMFFFLAGLWQSAKEKKQLLKTIRAAQV